MKNSSDLKGDLWNKVINWALNTSAHGFRNIFSSKNWPKKIFWIIALVTSISYCVYQVALIITLFFQFRVITHLKTVYEAPTNFPVVAICNLNAYNGHYSRDAMNFVLREKNISQDIYEPIDFIDNGVDHFKSTFEKMALNDQLDLKYGGFFLNEMMISCRFQKKACNESDFEHYHDYDYGNCYRFNSNKSNVLKTKKSGWRDGLRLELFIGDLDYQQQFTYKSGVRVIVHNQSDIAFSNENGIDVSVGFQTNIAIDRTMINQKPYPYSNCISSYLSNKILNRNFYLKTIGEKYPQMNKYSQNLCLKICLQEFLIKKCECFDLSLPRPNNSSTNATACENIDDLECINSEEAVFYENEIEKCYINCPKECFKIVYDLKVTTAKYPTKWYTSILNNSAKFRYFMWINELDEEYYADYLYLQQTILMVNIFYEQMSYNLIEEYPELSIDALLAFIGGNLGLFMGISVLSLFEIVEFVTYMIYYLIVKKKCLDLNRTKVELLKQ